MEIKVQLKELEENLPNVIRDILTSSKTPIPPFIKDINEYVSNLRLLGPRISKKVIDGKRLIMMNIWNPDINDNGHVIDLYGSINSDNLIIFTNWSLQG